MAVSPTRLKRVTANQLPSDELETFVTVTHIRPRNIPEHVRLATATGAGTGAAKSFEREKRFCAISPEQCQLFTNELDVFELQLHGHVSMFSLRSRTGVRFPKIAVPTRTSVAPSSITIAKSPLVPIAPCG